jgi:S-adenosylmethionine synthetase
MHKLSQESLLNSEAWETGSHHVGSWPFVLSETVASMTNKILWQKSHKYHIHDIGRDIAQVDNSCRSSFAFPPFLTDIPTATIINRNG